MMARSSQQLAGTRSPTLVFVSWVGLPMGDCQRWHTITAVTPITLTIGLTRSRLGRTKRVQQHGFHPGNAYTQAHTHTHPVSTLEMRTQGSTNGTTLGHRQMLRLRLNQASTPQRMDTSTAATLPHMRRTTRKIQTRKHRTRPPLRPNQSQTSTK